MGATVIQQEGSLVIQNYVEISDPVSRIPPYAEQ